MDDERIDAWGDVLRVLASLAAVAGAALLAVYLLGGCYRPTFRVVFYEQHRCNRAADDDVETLMETGNNGHPETKIDNRLDPGGSTDRR